ncbi:hypothetical protein BC831DRAFT_438842 [Entophlyctis helioformis]|nr:hypothetical protein BC831DRAFT_438842 [Entophlyctis helioformis]
MYLERMSFEPSDPFTSVDLNHFDAATTLPANGHAQGLPDAAQALAQQPPASEAGSQAGATALAGLAGDAAGPSNASSNASGSSGMSVFGLRDVLGQQDTRQYLYMLSPKVANDISSRLVPGLGKLDISWRTQLGQSGRLQTSQLSRKVPTVDLFEVTVVEQPDLIFVEQPFKLKIRMRNNVVGERLRLSIRGVKNKMTNVLLRGPNDIDVGTLDGAAHTDIDLEFFSLVAGLQRITGIQVTDKISGTTRDIDSLAVVRVRS